MDKQKNTATNTSCNGIIEGQIKLLEQANQKLFAEIDHFPSRSDIYAAIRHNALAIKELVNSLDLNDLGKKKNKHYVKQCKKCFTVFSSSCRKCPYCGAGDNLLREINITSPTINLNTKSFTEKDFLCGLQQILQQSEQDVRTAGYVVGKAKCPQCGTNLNINKTIIGAFTEKKPNQYGLVECGYEGNEKFSLSHAATSEDILP